MKDRLFAILFAINLVGTIYLYRKATEYRDKYANMLEENIDLQLEIIDLQNSSVNVDSVVVYVYKK